MLGFLIKKILLVRAHLLIQDLRNFNKIQGKLISNIIHKNKATKYLSLNNICSMIDWKSCPAITYDDIEPEILSIKLEHINYLSSDTIIAFSKSSGTTSKSKWIPVTKSFMNQNYLGGFDMLSLFLRAYPHSQILKGKNFSLTGSFTIENNFVTGDISALLTYYLHPFFKPFNTPKLEIATIADWEEKIQALMPILASSDIRWIAGVPSWMFLVIERLEAYCNKSIVDIWPNFEVFFHGGISMDPFKNKFESKFNQKIIFWQVYNASEGFLGVQCYKNSQLMTLLPCRDTYFEFIHCTLNEKNILKATELIVGDTYELLITNNSGLYRYRIGDVLKIHTLFPLQFEIIGRTKSCINTFGEELMVHNVEKALGILNSKMDFVILEYTVAPIIKDDLSGYHRWYIEFEQEPIDISMFTSQLDLILQSLNSDYQAKRYNDLILKEIEVKSIPKGSFHNWLKSKNRLNVQSKIPKLVSDINFQLELDRIIAS